jgi:hypothetical protein
MGHNSASGPLAGLLARAAEAGGGAAPVDRWNPPDCGRIPMRIAADGTWHYAGTPIGRDAMVRLFARILRREADGRTVLVTPVEKVTITVDDVAFLAVEIAAEGEGERQRLTLRTNVGDVVTAGPDHPVRFAAAADGGFVPYVEVRGGLEARLTRAAAIELADRLAERDGVLGLWSGGAFFPVPQP